MAYEKVSKIGTNIQNKGRAEMLQHHMDLPFCWLYDLYCSVSSVGVGYSPHVIIVTILGLLTFPQNIQTTS